MLLQRLIFEGFGSNGKGGISAAEVCEALQSIYHATIAANEEASPDMRKLATLETLDDEAQAVLKRVAAAVIFAASSEKPE